MKIRNLIALALSMTLLLFCCACGKNIGVSATPLVGLPSESPTGFVADILGASGSQIYTAESLKIKGAPAAIIAARFEDDIYLFCVSRDANYVSNGRWLLKCAVESDEMTELWRDSGTDAASGDIAVDNNGNVWLAEMSNARDGGYLSFTSSLTRISSDGSADTWELEDEDTHAVSNIIYLDGKLYLNCYGEEADKLIIINVDDGEPDIHNSIVVTPAEDSGTTLLASGGGSLCLFGNNGEQSYLHVLDKATGAAYNKILFETGISTVYSGDDEYSLYLSDGNNLYGYDIDTGEMNKLLNWVNCGMPDAANVISLGNGSMLCIRVDRSTLNDVCDILLPTEISGDEITTITLATLGLNYMLYDSVIEFNKGSRDTRIDLLDYSVYNTAGNSEAGYGKLTAELDAGNFPDILDLYGLPTIKYAANGCFENLYSLMDRDDTYTRDVFLENILSAYEYKGGLYELPTCFEIQTVSGDIGVVGSTPGWSLEQYREAVNESGIMSPLGEGLTRHQFFGYMVGYLGNALVDWESMTCDFESELFRGVLEISETLPASFNSEWNIYAAVQGGEQFLALGGINSLYSIRFNRALFGEDNYSFIGFPGTRDSGSVISEIYGFAISAASEHKAEAWNVLKSFLDSGSVTRSDSLPITKSGLDEVIARSIGEEKELIETTPFTQIWMGSAVSVEYKPEADAAALKELIAQQTQVSRQDEGILAIVTEASIDFFAGERSAEETAKAVQALAQDYLSGLMK